VAEEKYFKRLYNDDPSETMTTAVAIATCGEEHRQEDPGATAVALAVAN